ncbi:MAG TPA: hypothetical protein PL045_10250, partial [Chitinophagaceae bacterium]|nr:hypothetical protein [Chitinophagaceae bacterium]
MICTKAFRILSSFLLLISCAIKAQRIPVLNQIQLPHDYYYRELYLPQLTSGASSACWLPDSKSLVFSMQGSLWMQNINSDTAIQLTDGDGYDYQPDCSPNGSKIIFTRYNGSSEELMLLDLSTKNTVALTNNNAVNLEPHFSPDGKQIVFVSTVDSHRFLLYKADVSTNSLNNITCLTPGKQSEVKRYYYSAYDHAINPCWSADGKKIYFVSNHEVAHGTGNIVCINADGSDSIQTIRSEETSWNARPDISSDGSRIVYSSYSGGNFHQLWMLPAAGGYPMPLTYGEYDNTYPRWSPDGKQIAFISNRTGNTSLWIVNVYDGGQRQIAAKQLQYLQPHISLTITVRDEKGNTMPTRLSITNSKEKFYAPADAWIHADDSRYPATHKYEAHYFFINGSCTLQTPKDKLHIQAGHGPLYEIANTEIDTRQLSNAVITITLKKLQLPLYAGSMQSGDLHVHMNYGGHYLNTPAHLVLQAASEDVNYV